MKGTAWGCGPQVNYLTRSAPTSASGATQKGPTAGTTASAQSSGRSAPSCSSSDRNGPAFTHHARKRKLPLQEPGAKKPAVIQHSSAMTSTASLGIEQVAPDSTLSSSSDSTITPPSAPSPRKQPPFSGKASVTLLGWLAGATGRCNPIPGPSNNRDVKQSQANSICPSQESHSSSGQDQDSTFAHNGRLISVCTYWVDLTQPTILSGTWT